MRNSYIFDVLITINREFFGRTFLDSSTCCNCMCSYLRRLASSPLPTRLQVYICICTSKWIPRIYNSSDGETEKKPRNIPGYCYDTMDHTPIPPSYPSLFSVSLPGSYLARYAGCRNARGGKMGVNDRVAGLAPLLM